MKREDLSVSMHIEEYIGKGVVLKRLQNQLTQSELTEFNALADLHPELRQELVYAYDLLTDLSAAYPPHEVVGRFTEAYQGHLQQFKNTYTGPLPFAEARDVSNKYTWYSKHYRTVFYCYVIFLAIVMCITAYFYYRTR